MWGFVVERSRISTYEHVLSTISSVVRQVIMICIRAPLFIVLRTSRLLWTVSLVHVLRKDGSDMSQYRWDWHSKLHQKLLTPQYTTGMGICDESISYHPPSFPSSNKLPIWRWLGFDDKPKYLFGNWPLGLDSWEHAYIPRSLCVSDSIWTSSETSAFPCGKKC